MRTFQSSLPCIQSKEVVYSVRVFFESSLSLQQLESHRQERLQHGQQERYALWQVRELVHQDGAKVEETAVWMLLVERDHLFDERLEERRGLRAHTADRESNSPAAALHDPDIRLSNKQMITLKTYHDKKEVKIHQCPSHSALKNCNICIDSRVIVFLVSITLHDNL